MFDITTKQENLDILSRLPSEFKAALKRFLKVNDGKVLSIRCNMRDTGGHVHNVAGGLMFCIDTNSTLSNDLGIEDYDILMFDTLNVKDYSAYSEIFGALYTRNITVKMFDKTFEKMNLITIDELERCING